MFGIHGWTARGFGSVREAFAAGKVARFKLPKTIIFVDEVVRSPSGKADYRWAKARACEALGLPA